MVLLDGVMVAQQPLELFVWVQVLVEQPVYMEGRKMSGRVLALNRNWVPINVVDVFDAMQKVFSGRALVVDSETFMTYDFSEWVENWDDAAKMAKTAENRVMRGGRVTLVMPEVIVFKEYKGVGYKVNSTRKPSFSRRNLFIRDRNTCQFCAKKFRTEELTMDHIVPRCKGGKVTWKNIVLACQSCNNKKGSKSLAESGLRLIRQPFEPREEDLKLGPVERLRMKLGRNVPKTWEQFLGKVVSDMYWNISLKE